MTEHYITIPYSNADEAHIWCWTHVGQRWDTMRESGGQWTHDNSSISGGTATFRFFDLGDKILMEFKLRFG